MENLKHYKMETSHGQAYKNGYNQAREDLEQIKNEMYHYRNEFISEKRKLTKELTEERNKSALDISHLEKTVKQLQGKVKSFEKQLQPLLNPPAKVSFFQKLLKLFRYGKM